VLLLDEIEKAHPDVFKVLLQVMDHGTLTDNNGKKADFRHVVLIMTSNVGARDLQSRRRGVGFGERGSRGRRRRPTRTLFSPEFRNRLDARIKFKPLAGVNTVEAPFIAERFRLERPLGAGGMGVVYAAFDLAADDHPVALKMQRHPDAASTQRFLREAEILAGVQTPGIVGYRGHGQLEDGRVWIALEWLVGETLQQRLLRGPLAPSEALALGTRVAGSLAQLHGRGVVHRDIKPENLFLRGADPADVCLLDLGIARLLDPDRRTTRHGMVVGTPAYMAPEQARAAPELDHRADLYALGVVLYECLSGRQAWPGENPLAVMVKLLVEPAPRLSQARPDLAGPLDALVTRLMSTRPADRPATAERCAAELAALASRLEELPALADWGSPTPAPASTHARDPSGLAAVELRICTLLLVCDAAGDAPVASEAERWQAHVEALLSENDARSATLADGSLLVVFAGRDMPTDQATRAARCALALAAHRPSAAVVVATGALRIAPDATDAPPLGQVIDRAVEALRATAPSRVRLDATTAGLLDARFVLAEPLPGEHGERVLLGEIEPSSRARLVRGRASPFVGRERELLLLDAWLRETLTTRRARLVSIHGPAGMGKTRLRDELLARWMSAQPTLHVVAGSCPERGSHGAGMRDLLQRAVGTDTAEPAEQRRHRLRAWLGLNLGEDAVARALPFLAELLGISDAAAPSPLLVAARGAPEEMAEAVNRAVTEALRGLLGRGPVALILDDAQRLDPGTHAMLTRALGVLHDQPLFVLRLQRTPPAAEPAGVPRAELSLPPLSDTAADRFVSAVLGGAPELRARLVARAAGTPYLLEELVRAAADGEVDRLPETVLAMVQARIAQRGALEKRVLRAASIFGVAFTGGGVAHLLPDLTRATLDAALDALAAAELLDAHASGWRFAQETIREAAYAMLTPEDRLTGHARAADWLRAQAPGSSWEIAEHLISADQAEAAARYFAQAADLSLERNDLTGATDLATRGLAACAGVSDADAAVGALHQILAHVAGWQGRRVELAHHAEQALQRLSPSSLHWFRALSDWITVQTDFEDPRTRSRLEALVDAAERVDRPESRAAAAMCLCRVAARVSERGANAQTEALFRVAFDLGRDPDLPPPAGAMVQRTIAVRAWRHGDVGTARAALRRALYEFERSGFERPAAGVRGNLGAVCNELGLYDEALTLLDATVREAGRLGLVRVEAAAWHNLGHTLFRIGRLDEAEDAELTALAHFDAQSDRLMAGAARCYLARIHTHQGRPAQAESEARRAAAALADAAVPLYVLAQAALTEALLAQARADAACRAAEDGARAAATLAALGEGEILFAVMHGEALDAAGRPAEASLRFEYARQAVLRRAAALADPEVREAWTQAVAENVQAVARAEESVAP
jgi:tetratricopeptide (TPR) repeat protein